MLISPRMHVWTKSDPHSVHVYTQLRVPASQRWLIQKLTHWPTLPHHASLASWLENASTFCWNQSLHSSPRGLHSHAGRHPAQGTEHAHTQRQHLQHNHYLQCISICKHHARWTQLHCNKHQQMLRLSDTIANFCASHGISDCSMHACL